MFENYKGARCIITGGAGFIGKALATKLVELGAEVNIIDIKPVMGVHAKDVRDYWQMEKEFLLTFDGKKEGYVFHLAALTEVGDSVARPYDYYETNILGTLNILELVKKYRARINRCVVASTDKVYGRNPQLKRDLGEWEHLYPSADPYSNSKRHMDNLVCDYMRTYQVPVRMLRSANTYGPGQTNETTLITNTVKHLLQNKPVPIHQNCMYAVREWLYIDDAVKAYLTAGMKPALSDKMNPDSIWNVGSGEVEGVIQIIEKINTILRENGVSDKPLETVFIDDGVERIEEQRLNSIKLRQAMGKDWKPVDINSGLAFAVRWYVAHYEQLRKASL